MEDNALPFIFGFILLIICFLIYRYIVKREAIKYNLLNNYRLIDIGIEENDIFPIMGSSFNKSLLENGDIRYVWGKKDRYVEITCREGVVVEVKPFNV